MTPILLVLLAILLVGTAAAILLTPGRRPYTEDEIRQIAEQEANDGMTADDFLAFWQRHPDFGPNGRFYRGPNR